MGHLQGSPETFYDGRTSLIWGSDVPYAPYHQAPTVKGRPPKREIIFITRQDKKELADFVGSFIDNVLRRIK